MPNANVTKTSADATNPVSNRGASPFKATTMPACPFEADLALTSAWALVAEFFLKNCNPPRIR
jgi:hypothetical protein